MLWDATRLGSPKGYPTPMGSQIWTYHHWNGSQFSTASTPDHPRLVIGIPSDGSLSVINGPLYSRDLAAEAIQFHAATTQSLEEVGGGVPLRLLWHLQHELKAGTAKLVQAYSILANEDQLTGFLFVNLSRELTRRHDRRLQRRTPIRGPACSSCGANACPSTR